MLRWGVALCALLLLAEPPGASAEPAAPGFRLKVLDQARVIDSRALLGKKVVVLRFQASYCRKCARQAAAFNRLVERYHPKGVEFVALHVQDTAVDTRRFVRAQKLTCPVVLDPRLVIAGTFDFKGTPYTVVIDRRGEMVARIHGESAIGRLPRILDAALASAPQP